MSTNEIRVPDIGDFKDVPIIEVHVQPGSQINVDDPLISLESDKATMEVPAPQAGTVKEIKVKVGDRVSMGDLIVVMEGAGAPAVPPKERITEAAAPSPGGGAPGYGSPSGVYESVEIRVPDIGDFKDVPIIEVHVQPGATISADDPLISLESDKATMEVPAPQGGTVKDIKVKVGDRVSQGDLIATLEGQGASAGAGAPGQGQAGYGTSALDAKGNGAARAPAPTAKPPGRRRRATTTPRCWCSAPVPAATRPRSAPPTSARRWCWSSAGRASGASASTSAAFRPRRCCMPPR